jgi:hypothetical protein
MITLIIVGFCALHSISGKYILIDVKDDEDKNDVMPLFRSKDGDFALSRMNSFIIIYKELLLYFVMYM